MISASAIDTAVEEFREIHQIPGLALAVIEGAGTPFIKCTGLSNVELGTPIHRRSVFELSSLTKHMTARAIWKQIGDGVLALDRKLSDFVDDVPDHWIDIRLGHLLNHAAGLQNRFEGNVAGRYFLDYRKEDLLTDAKVTPPLAPPGARFEYSDQGYFLLACVLERVTGLSFQKCMSATFFDPIKMSDTTVHSKRKVIANRVAGYELEAGVLVNVRRDSEQEAQGHFGVMSTIDDLVKWERELQNGILVPLSCLGEIESFCQSVTMVDDFVTTYASGWFVTKHQGRRFAEHTGMTGNYYFRDLDTGFAVVLLTNLADSSKSENFGRTIARLCDPSLPGGDA